MTSKLTLTDKQRTFFSSVREVLLLLILAVLPILACIVIKWNADDGDVLSAVQASIFTGEMLAYASSFVSPIFLLIIDVNKSEYKLPWVTFMFFSTFILWSLSTITYVVARLALFREINLDPARYDTNYFNFALALFSLSIIIWIYIAYHNKRSQENPKLSIRKEEKDFTGGFSSRLLKTRGRD